MRSVLAGCFVAIILLYTGCKSEKKETVSPIGQNNKPVPRKVYQPKVPENISEREAFVRYLDTLSSPVGLSIIMNDPDNSSTFTFCNDTLVIMQISSKEWMLGHWEKKQDLISIHFFKAAGERGIGDPVVFPSDPAEQPIFAEYVPYVYEAYEEKSLYWNEMKTIMKTGGNSVFVLADKKASCDLKKYSPELPGKYPFVSSRFMEESEFVNLKEEEISLMINEVYARYGFIFTNRKLRDYFKKQSWYKPKYTNIDKYLQGIEERNLQLLKQKEKQLQQSKPRKKAVTTKKKTTSSKKPTK